MSVISGLFLERGREERVFLSLKIFFVIANIVDLDEMAHYAAFHLGLHCLPKTGFRSHLYTKG